MDPRPQDRLTLRDELVNAFSRQEMVDLAASVGVQFQVVIADDALRAQAASLVEYMVRREELSLLLRTAVESRPARQSLAEIASHLEERTNFTFQLRQQLRQILSPGSVPANQVRIFHSAAWPSGLAGRKKVAEGFEAAIALAGISPDLGATPAQKFPILVFVERIAGLWRLTAKPNDARALSEWSQGAARLFGLPDADLAALRENVRTIPPALNYLLIQFHPESAGNKFRLAAHLWLNDERTDIEHDGRPRTVTELPAALASIIDEATRRVGEFVIEFLVPSALLNQPFDSWTIAVSSFLSERVGLLYPVVVRLYERIHDINPPVPGIALQRQKWREKWALLAEKGPPPFEWIGANAKPADVYRLLAAPAARHCAALTFPAAGPQGMCQTVHAALAAGTPVLIWVREGVANTQAIKAEIERALQSVEAFEDLPSVVRAYRSTAPADLSHPANQFTLLYDNPDRVPPPPPRNLGIETSH